LFTTVSKIPTIKEYHGVDPFLGGYDSSDAMSKELAQVNSSLVWASAVQRVVSEFGCKFRLHHGFSTEVYKDFPQKSIDCIFIDGDHTFEGVSADIRNWAPIIKPRGYMFFDDVSKQFPGTVKAIHHFVNRNELKLVPINAYNNFYVQLPDAKEAKK